MEVPDDDDSSRSIQTAVPTTNPVMTPPSDGKLPFCDDVRLTVTEEPIPVPAEAAPFAGPAPVPYLTCDAMLTSAAGAFRRCARCWRFPRFCGER